MDHSSSTTTKASKVTKSRARKPPTNKKRPRKMGHIHGGNSEELIVWGQRWFPSGVAHANGGHEVELDLRRDSDTSPSTRSPSSTTPSNRPSPSVQERRSPHSPQPSYPPSNEIPASTFYNTTLPASVSPPSTRNTSAERLGAYPSAQAPHDQSWVSNGLIDNPSVSYNLFTPQFGPTDQGLSDPSPDSMLLFSSTQSPDAFCTFDGTDYSTSSYPSYSHQSLASPISAPSPASSDGWTLSPVRPPNEVEAGYGLIHDPSNNVSNMFVSESMSSASPMQHIGRPRSSYPPYNGSSLNIPAASRHSRASASGYPSYHPMPSHSGHMSSDGRRLSPARHTRSTPTTANGYSYPITSPEGILPYSNSSTYHNAALTSSAYASSSNQIYPYVDSGDRFDSTYSA